jgi:hypothetical protein
MDLGFEWKLSDVAAFIDNIGCVIFIFIFLFNKLINKLKSKYLKKNHIKEDVERISNIYERLIKCRLYFNASRITITQFHNGEKYYSNNSILKMSITHESDDDGVSRVINSYQNILVSKYNKFIESLLREEVLSYRIVSELNTTHEDDMVLDLKVSGTEAFYAIKLLSKNGDIIGFISLSFDEDKDINIEKYKEYANMIGFSLRA